MTNRFVVEKTYQEGVEYTKGIIRIRKSKTEKQHNVQKPGRGGGTQVLKKDKQFLLH